MSNFEQAIKPVLAFEGVTLHSLGYVNDPDDNGGETIAGISRKFWKDWEGWKIVDNCIQEPDFPVNMTHNQSLIALINDFYKVRFWGRMSEINDQSIVDLLIDSGVNEGTIPAIKRAQNILGLAENGKLDDTLINDLNNL